jgi:hypothetical protein
MALPPRGSTCTQRGERPLKKGWRHPFCVIRILYIPKELENRPLSEWQRPTNTRPFPKNTMLFKTWCLAQNP